MILEVPAGHVTFKSGAYILVFAKYASEILFLVSDQFKSSWRHGTACPPVRRVYKIQIPATSLAGYNAYKYA